MDAVLAAYEYVITVQPRIVASMKRPRGARELMTCWLEPERLGFTACVRYHGRDWRSARGLRRRLARRSLVGVTVVLR